MRVAILGASGVIGHALVEQLARTHEVTAVARRPGRTSGVRWIAADLASATEAAQALADAEIAVHLVHSLGRADFAERDRVIAENVAQAAARHGLSQIVYLGGLGDDSPELSKHLRSRRETARALA